MESWTATGASLTELTVMVTEAPADRAEVHITAKTPADVPQDYRLLQNYPNPFNPSTKIHYELPRASNVELVVFDMLGRRIQTIVDARQEAGRYEVTFHADGLATGPYVYRLRTGSRVLTGSMLFVK